MERTCSRWTNNDNMSLDQRSELFDNQAIYDAFARARVSNPFTLWSGSLLGDNRPLFWDDAETAGSGTGSVYSANKSSVTLTVSDATAGTRVRQSKDRFRYQPGKSQLTMVTFTLGAGQDGITKRVGLFDDKNGFFLQQVGDTLSFVRRSYRTGTAVDTVVNESSWRKRSHEPLPVLDASKSQILVIDYEWLGVGTARMGFVVDGVIQYLYEWHHANKAAGVYMTTPNLPVRYEIANDGTGGADSLECICSTVMSEGGQNPTGQTLGLTTVPTHVDASSADTNYAVIGVRLKSTHLDNVVKVRQVQVLNEGNTDFYWSLVLNPTVAGTFSYADVDNTPIQAAYGATANTITGGFVFANGLSTSASVAADIIDNLLYLGSKIDGTPDEIVLCCTPLSANADIQGTIVLDFAA